MAGLIGVFGGTFDPPHLGHLILASYALDGLGLDEVRWVLTPRSPLKPDQTITPEAIRIRMLEAAIAPEPRFSLSRVDLNRPPPHYSADTVERLADEEPDRGLVFLLGSDALADLRRWHEPERLVRRCAAVGVMRRPGSDPELDAPSQAIEGLAAKLRIFDAPLVSLSGREIRHRAARGLGIRFLVPEPVLRIIQDERVYDAP